MKDGLARSSSKVGGGITAIFTNRKLDDDALEELEDLLITSDLGVSVSTKLIAALSKSRFDKEIAPDEVKGILADQIATSLEPVARPLEIKSEHKPHVVLMVGVNGAGKTTTIGKLAQQYKSEGKSVMMAAGDTFRAAAIEQLKVWGERVGSEVISRPQGSDPAGLAFDALAEAKKAGTDVLLFDTAGRLHNKTELMAELQKVIRVIKKQDATAPHDTVLILDATTGQNAINQVATFKELVDITGLIVTKLDGSARGGVVVGLAEKFGLPVHAIGVGETADDLQPFDPKAFAAALVGAE